MTSVSMVEVSSHTGNPIDLVEEIVVANDWAHDRASEEEMIVEISGRWCDYRMYFLWQEELSALHFSCGFHMKVAKRRRRPLYELLALANERLWLGHFDLAAGEAAPSFRYAVLLRGIGMASAEQVEDLVDIALSECERFYPAFQLVIWGGKLPEEAMATAMIEPIGEACPEETSMGLVREPNSFNPTPPQFVTPGLDPGIHVDGRDKPGHDEQK